MKRGEKFEKEAFHTPIVGSCGAERRFIKMKIIAGTFTVDEGLENYGMPAAATGMISDEDAYSKNLESRIAAKQKELMDISKSEKLSPEAKQEKRQEVQKEIAELNKQLRQHQLEQQKKKAQENQTAKAEKSRNESKDGDVAEISKEGMQAMLSADAAMGQVNVQTKVEKEFEGRQRVLEVEAKLDAGRRGGVTGQKIEELSDTSEKLDAVGRAKGSLLSKAEDDVERAREAEEEKKEDIREMEEEEEKEKESSK